MESEVKRIGRRESGIASAERGAIHLGENVSDDRVVVVLRDVRQLRPAQYVVEVVLVRVVLRQTEQVAVLDVQQIVHLQQATHIHNSLQSRV